MIVRTRVSSVLSPWLSRCQAGDVHTVAVSHGEGRLVGPEGLLRILGELQEEEAPRSGSNKSVN